MISVSVQFLKNKYHCFSGLTGFSGAMLRNAIVNKRTQEFQKLLKNSKNIDDIVNILKTQYKDNIEANLCIYTKLDNNEYILNHKFQVITKSEIKKFEFVPYIEYDVENIRIDTVEPLEQKLHFCKSKDEQIETIKKYIEKPNRRFKKWETKPIKIFLYHSYNEEPIEFKIKYDKHISSF